LESSGDVPGDEYLRACVEPMFYNLKRVAVRLMVVGFSAYFFH